MRTRRRRHYAIRIAGRRIVGRRAAAVRVERLVGRARRLCVRSSARREASFQRPPPRLRQLFRRSRRPRLFVRLFLVRLVPGPDAAARASLIISLIALRLPADSAHVPIRLFKAALQAFHKPAARVLFHGLRPRGGEDGREKFLHPAHGLNTSDSHSGGASRLDAFEGRHHLFGVATIPYNSCRVTRSSTRGGTRPVGFKTSRRPSRQPRRGNLN